MRLSRKIVVVSAFASIASFLAYVSPLPAFVLDYQQMNEVMLAIFGAGVSSLSVGFLEYEHHRNVLEFDLLEHFEPLLSAIAALQCFEVESVGEASCKSMELLKAYYEERELSDFPCFACLHGDRKAAHRLLRAMGYKTENEMRQSLDDPHSNFNRYIDRQSKAIEKAADEYMHYLERVKRELPRLKRMVQEMDYLPSRKICFCKIAVFSNAIKTKSLWHAIEVIEMFLSDLGDVFDKCRLFSRDECGYSDLLLALEEAREKLRKIPDSNLGSRSVRTGNYYADELFSSVSAFEQHVVRRRTDRRYVNPWW